MHGENKGSLETFLSLWYHFAICDQVIGKYGAIIMAMET